MLLLLHLVLTSVFCLNFASIMIRPQYTSKEGKACGLVNKHGMSQVKESDDVASTYLSGIAHR